MNNIGIRQAAKDANVRLWQIAEGLNIADTTFSRKLRHELTPDDKSKVYAIIAQIAAEQEAKQ